MGHFSTLIRAMGLAVTVALPAAAQDASTVMATVNGTDITLGHMIALRGRLPEQYQTLPDDELFEGILEQLIQQTALSQEIEKDGGTAFDLKLENEMRAFLASEFVEKIGTAEINEDDIKAAFDAEFAGREREEEFSAAHILLETEEEALAVIKTLEGGADFAEVAKEKSTGPSGPRGGDLGWFVRGSMVPEFETAVLGLEDGAISAPVQTQFGWHIIKRNESRTTLTLDDVLRGEIENRLRAEAIETAITKATDDATIERAEVEVDPALIKQTDLIAN